MPWNRITSGLAIATLGIGEIIVAVLRNEDWLARGVKNVAAIPRPVPYETDLQQNPAFVDFATSWGFSAAEASGIWVKLCYMSLFLVVLLLVILLAELALKHRLPGMFGTRDNVEAGGLMSYAPDHRDLTRRAATYIDKILKGAKPADLPVEQASKYQLVINLKTARALGLEIPPTLLARADEVIE